MSMSSALEGVIVLELAHIMAGPYCTMLLGDLGADVIKVEKPAGDDTRRFGPPFLDDESAAFLAVNRNKRGISVNLKSEEGVRIVRELAARADIVVENHKPGTLNRLGLGYEALREINPAIIYCSITGFGQTGPYRERGGFDLVAQAMSGLISVTGHVGGKPTKIGVPISDLGAGLYAAQAILAAYIHRLRTGEGQYIDVSLLDAAVSLTVWESASYFATGSTPKPVGAAHRLLAPYQLFRCADRDIVIGAGNQRAWRQLCEVVGRPDLASDERFVDNAARNIHQDELAHELSLSLQGQSAAYWLARLEAAGIPCGPVYTIRDVYHDEHLQARGMQVMVEHPSVGPTYQVGSPIKLSGTPTSIRRPAPLLGQHTDEVLTWLGIPEDEISRLREQGAVV